MNSYSVSESKTKNRHQLIKEYAFAEFRLFPLSKDRIPLDPGWQQTPVNPNIDPSVLPQCYGIALTEADFIIDCDPRRFAPGENEFQKLCEKIGVDLYNIDTFIVKTGSGGFHMYFKKPINQANDVYMFAPGLRTDGQKSAIEFKTAGRYIAAAGSVGKNGVYSVHHGDCINIAHAPYQLLEFATRPKQPTLTEIANVDADGAIAVYYKWLVENAPLAIEYQGGNQTTYDVACRGKDYALSEETTLQMLELYYNFQKCRPAWTPEELATIVSNAYSYSRNTAGNRTMAAQFKLTPELLAEISDIPDLPTPQNTIAGSDSDDKIRWDTVETGKDAYVTKLPTLNNCENFFRAKQVRLKDGMMTDNELRRPIKRNEFTGGIDLVKAVPWRNQLGTWTSNDTIMLKHFCSRWYGYQASKDLWEEAVTVHSTNHSYHPLKEEIESVKWDGVPRVDRFCTVYLGCADTTYTREVGRVTLIGSIARVYSPGCQFDTVMVIEGPQGALKSTFVRVWGGKYAANLNKFDPTDKDTAIKLHGKWAVEIAEIDKITKKYDSAVIKDWITTLVDCYRPPYERHAIDQERRCFLVGTVNPDGAGYLSDTTGNRRFLPIYANKIDIEAFKRDRAQIFAEALVRYKQGEKFYIEDAEVLIEAQREQLFRLEGDPILEIIDTYIEEKQIVTTTILEIAKCLGLFGAKITKAEQGKIARALDQLGFKRGRKSDKKRTWYWYKDMGV